MFTKRNVKRALCHQLIDNKTNQLVDTIYCKKGFLLSYARIYFVMYRVLIRKLPDMTCNVLVSSGKPSLKLLRDIGSQYSTGNTSQIILSGK